jgi:hypothetical protein
LKCALPGLNSLSAEVIVSEIGIDMSRFSGTGSAVIVPALAGQPVRWRGWHAFRRGLTTNLHQLA